jgi:hypothetical protein
MKIPKNQDERFTFFMETLNKCISSRDNRKKLYSEWKGYFLSGSAPNATGAVMNKIYYHIEQLCALVYSSETTRFSVDLTPSASDLEKSKVPALMTAINEEWHNSNADLTFTMALMWSFVYGSMFVKLRISGTEIETAVVHPADVGVLREDVHGLWRQEAFCHAYFISKSQFEYEMKQIPHPRLDKIMSQIIAKPRPAEASTTAGVDRLVTSSSDPQVIGNVNFDLSGSNKYRPDVSEDLLQMYELYVFDDEEKDFRIVTIADPGITIFDRPIRDLFIEKEITLIQICPNPSHEYFWGYSETEKLIPLQKMRNTRMDQINHLLNLQANPPKWGTGFSNDMAEMLSALDTPSGGVFSDMPGGKIEQLTPKIPDDLFKEIREIDQMFEEMSGITNVIQGKGEQGVRSQGHAANLARLGSSRAKRRALIIEDSLEKIATLYLQLKQAYDPNRLRDENGLPFIPDHFTTDYFVKVDGHSNSPIFMEDQRQLAFDLFKSQVIDGESLLDLLDVPMKDLLKERYKVLQAQKAAAAKEQQQAELQKEKLKLVK